VPTSVVPTKVVNEGEEDVRRSATDRGAYGDE
jgi:hypothetical protein